MPLFVPTANHQKEQYWNSARAAFRWSAQKRNVESIARNTQMPSPGVYGGHFEDLNVDNFNDHDHSEQDYQIFLESKMLIDKSPCYPHDCDARSERMHKSFTPISYTELEWRISGRMF